MPNSGNPATGLIVMGATAAALGVYFAIDSLVSSRLPVGHKAQATLNVNQPIDLVFALVQSVESQPQWDSSIKRVITQSRDDRTPRRKVLIDKDSIHMYDIVVEPPTKLVRNMVSHRESWICEWTFDLSPDGDGTQVLLTEKYANPRSILRYLRKRGTDPLARVNHQLTCMARAMNEEPRITGATVTVIQRAGDVWPDRT